MANRVNLRAVAQSQERRRRAAAAGITYEEQLVRDQKEGRELGGQRGLAQALGPDGQPLAGRGAAPPAATPTQASPTAAAPAAAAPAAAARGRGAGPANQADPDDDDDDDNEVVFAGLVGTGGGGLTALVFAA